MKANPSICPKLTVSEETQSLIECLESLNNHWEQTKYALCKTYSEKTSLELMDGTYMPAFDELKKAVQQFVLMSIENNIGLVDFKEI